MLLEAVRRKTYPLNGEQKILYIDIDAHSPFAALCQESGLSQKELARRVGTSQQQISRLESPSYESHSLSMIRRVVEVLGATVQVQIQRKKQPRRHAVPESAGKY